MPPRKDPARHLTDLRGAAPRNAVRNLAGQLERSIGTSARFRLFAVEANHDGLENTAQTYERVDHLDYERVDHPERRQILELELQLRRQLDAALAEAQPDEELRR
jgi:hypothetical protein